MPSPTTRYVALLRGVSPMNAKMHELARAFELAGFTEVKTVLGSGNLVFNAPRSTEAKLVEKAEAAMQKHLGKAFPTIIRSVDDLRFVLATKPFGAKKPATGAKRVVTFLRHEPERGVALPLEEDGVVIIKRIGREVFTSYVPGPQGPVFMRLIEKTFGKEVTTRTWETVEKLAR